MYYIAFWDGKQIIYFGRKGDFHVKKFPMGSIIYADERLGDNIWRQPIDGTKPQQK